MESISISTDKNLLDLDLIYDFIGRQSYWAQNIPFETLKRSIDNSLCFGVYDNGSQIGFARVISDNATFAYLADVFIVPEYRGRGLSKMLVSYIISYSELQGLRRWLLATADAHGLYKQFGFTELSQPDNIMEIKNADVYKNAEVGDSAANGTSE
ncbi:GNAT family N-acetyltransferase [Pedobacter sp. HMF7647]|uniref:GNAT family N-acetyltransferase n=1 Tax=Hufsiella arboris TaxID=2695275 RepID=A0A7K1Y9B1_9SPHI|nr:GNAT family N-acetyltransferase [Hufsiella arboris]MXV50679.1 GNAT family N-acetyltransferase [Hufsiella arboris]